MQLLEDKGTFELGIRSNLSTQGFKPRAELESATAPSDPETLRTRLLDGLVSARDGAVARGVPLARADAAAWAVAALLDDLALNTPWGGTSAWGLDCSGLVHLTLRSLGELLPRDAHDQADCAAVEPVPLDDVRPGDLYFFARPGQRVYHVGFVTSPVAADGTRWMLHAPEGGELIENAPLAPHRLETLVSAGRVRKRDAGQLATYH